MLHRSSEIGSLAYCKILKEILSILVALLLSKINIISRISFLMQGDIRNEST